MTTDDD